MARPDSCVAARCSAGRRRSEAHVDTVGSPAAATQCQPPQLLFRLESAAQDLRRCGLITVHQASFALSNPARPGTSSARAGACCLLGRVSLGIIGAQAPA